VWHGGAVFGDFAGRRGAERVADQAGPSQETRPTFLARGKLAWRKKIRGWQFFWGEGDLEARVARGQFAGERRSGGWPQRERFAADGEDDKDQSVTNHGAAPSRVVGRRGREFFAVVDFAEGKTAAREKLPTP
jgi:hypothetical protein